MHSFDSSEEEIQIKNIKQHPSDVFSEHDQAQPSENRLQKQISELKRHKHIEKVLCIQPHVFKVVYYPESIESMYASNSYTLQFLIPENYPQKPPIITFVDKIYHLNVDPASGRVFMGIIGSDWTPFLSLNAIVDSLDEVLEEPDEDYPATTRILEEYHNDIDLYIEKVRHTLGANKKTSKEIEIQEGSFEEEVVEEVIDAKDISSEQQIRKQAENDPKQFFSSNSQEKRVLQSYGRLKKYEAQTDEIKQIKTPVLNSKQAKGSETIYLNNQSNKQPAQKTDQRVLGRQGQQPDNGKKYQKLVSSRYEQTNSKIESSANLKKAALNCQELINLYSEELHSLERNIPLANSSRLKKILEERCQKLQEMICELYILNQEVDEKLLQSVKMEVRKLV